MIYVTGSQDSLYLANMFCLESSAMNLWMFCPAFSSRDTVSLHGMAALHHCGNVQYELLTSLAFPGVPLYGLGTILYGCFEKVFLVGNCLCSTTLILRKELFGVVHGTVPPFWIAPPDFWGLA